MRNKMQNASSLQVNEQATLSHETANQSKSVIVTGLMDAKFRVNGIDVFVDILDNKCIEEIKDALSEIIAYLAWESSVKQKDESELILYSTIEPLRKLIYVLKNISVEEAN